MKNKPSFKDFLIFGLGEESYKKLTANDRILSLEETQELILLYSEYKKMINEPFTYSFPKKYL